MICFVSSLLLSIYNKNNEVLHSDIGQTENFAPILQDESCNKIKKDHLIVNQNV